MSFFFSAGESARMSMHANKGVGGDVSDNFAGKGVKQLNLENKENENLHTYKYYICTFICSYI